MDHMTKDHMKIFSQVIILLFWTLSIGLAGALQVAQELKPEGVLRTLAKNHPRLLLTDARLQELKKMSGTDGRLNRYAQDVIAAADKHLVKPPILREFIGPRLLSKSKECLLRVYDLAFAYRWTGEKKYFDAAEANMRTVCAFRDWNPPHFLDVAEMTHGVAIGYDWLYNDMDQPTRDLIRAGLMKHAVKRGMTAYEGNRWWVKVEHNWNQVCNGGLLIGALAVAETDSAAASFIITKAIEYLPSALKNYGPDGAWGEGPGYWGYATDYTAYGISALQTALGKDFGLSQLPGMNLTGYFPIYTAGPTGLMLNYADAHEWTMLEAPHTEMFLANVYNNDDFSNFVIDQLETRTASVYDVIWYRPHTSVPAKRALDKFFDGKVALYFSRSSWTDTNALWVGIKAGYNKVNHAHLDLGNFELDAMGVRWARDLGSDNYNLPEYFYTLRYTYYRLMSASHNIPVLNGKNQNEDAVATFVKHREGIAEPFSVIDLTDAYDGCASSVLRGMKVVDERRSVLIQDEFSLAKACEVAWGMTTDAEIRIINAKQAELTLKGERMIAKILSPENAAFSSESAHQDQPQNENIGVSRLMVRIPGAAGNVTVSILLAPEWPGADSNYSLRVTPLSAW